ncbi:hypothetical protein FRZ67_14915 [Panacibacter ginsenosidivorans]|uniref:Uncharacterized protein n=1 Tax=Panacibacter ginsenosidivorans TaxID=1813871 RepID=A0A5B8VAZ8_9BACT|nr:hypothetical protein [Panacibacter ginsenosidivorans]QEC68532.1 hypothetical protein FRZ67_14915 [Panacibacter ginsenosidivorans]
MKFEIPNWLILLGAAGQMFTAFIYPYIRHKVFDWYNDIKKLKPLNQEIAKTYGRYIQGLNFSFGLISVLFTEELKNKTGLAVALTGLIAAYWTGKLITQFSYYPMYQIPRKPFFKVGEVLMNTMFVSFCLIFVGLFVSNLSGYLNK